ncbi:MAG: hypothetical protein AB8G14_13670 [Ilumatobacter sp.]
MAFEDSDRRRTTLLGILTLVALPALFFVTRADDTSANSTDGVEVGADGIPVADNGPSRPPLVITDAEPTFLDGPVASANPGVAEIAVPARPAVEPIRLDASFRSTVAGVRSCLVRELRSGLSVTVTNLDNGRSITCVTSVAPFNQTADLVLHTDTFSLLADLTEAPISVEVTQ